MYDGNVYYNPEKHGLAVLHEIDEDGLSYEFHMLNVWEHQDGRLFWAEDWGCSCPSPFETYNSIDSLTLITKQTLGEFIRQVSTFPGDPGKKIDVITSVMAKV